MYFLKNVFFQSFLRFCCSHLSGEGGTHLCLVLQPYAISLGLCSTPWGSNTTTPARTKHIWRGWLMQNPKTGCADTQTLKLCPWGEGLWLVLPVPWSLGRKAFGGYRSWVMNGLSTFFLIQQTDMIFGPREDPSLLKVGRTFTCQTPPCGQWETPVHLNLSVFDVFSSK